MRILITRKATEPNRVSQVNEVLDKLFTYNLTVVVHEMFENGIAPSLSTDSPTSRGS
jgi:hypothetical protein